MTVDTALPGDTVRYSIEGQLVALKAEYDGYTDHKVATINTPDGCDRKFFVKGGAQLDVLIAGKLKVGDPVTKDNVGRALNETVVRGKTGWVARKVGFDSWYLTGDFYAVRDKNVCAIGAVVLYVPPTDKLGRF